MKYTVIYIFIYFFIIFIAVTFPQKINTIKASYYKEGIEALGKKDVASAEQFFTRSVRENSDVPSLFELSKIYINQGTIRGRRKARELLEKAIWKEPKNIKLRLTYASLMENYGKGIAFKKYNDIVDIDSECADAWYNMGRIKSLEFDDYNNSFNRTEEGIDLNLEKFAKEIFKEAESYLLKALKYDSLKADTYLKLSFLYEDAGMPGKGVSLLEKLIKLYPDNTDAHLFLGLLYYKISRMKESYNEYQDALILMPVSERLDFTYNSVVELLDPVAAELIKSLKPVEVRKFIDAFWNTSDPLFLTQYNERLLEHYSRVAYSDLRFSLPNKPGWKTDRGEIVLRYGEPLKRKRYRPQINAGGRTQVQVKTDVWEYKDMTFGFEDTYMSGNFVFSAPAPGSRYISQFEGNTLDFTDYLRRVRFESYSPKYEGPVFSIPYNIVQFKDLNNPNNTDVYFNYALSYNDSSLKSNIINYKYEWGLFFNDNYYNTIYRNKGSISRLPVSASIENDSLNYAVNSAEMTVRPDSGYLAFEIIRTVDKGVSSNHVKFKTSVFNTSNLDISDILLAEKINTDQNVSFPLKRKNINILPNPTSTFTKNDNLFLYYEVYNLAANNNGLTDFEQKITIKEVNNENGFEKAVSSLLNFAGFNKKEERITLSSRYQTLDRNSQMYLQLNMDKLKPGSYVILVSIFDNISKKEVSKSTVVRWQ